MYINLYIQPGAKKTEFSGEHNGIIKLRVAAPPVEGAANKAVLEFIAKHLDIPKSAVKLVAGAKSRTKTVDVDETKLKDRSKLDAFIKI